MSSHGRGGRPPACFSQKIRAAALLIQRRMGCLDRVLPLKSRLLFVDPGCPACGGGAPYPPREYWGSARSRRLGALQFMLRRSCVLGAMTSVTMGASAAAVAAVFCGGRRGSHGRVLSCPSFPCLSFSQLLTSSWPPLFCPPATSVAALRCLPRLRKGKSRAGPLLPFLPSRVLLARPLTFCPPATSFAVLSFLPRLRKH